MNQFKLIVTDLDGTLLRNDETISDYTLSILRRCQLKGIKIAFATARSYIRVQPYLNLTPNDAVICHNGASIYIGKNRIPGLSISTELASGMLCKLHNTYPHMPIIAKSCETLYANFDVSKVFGNIEAINTNFTKLPGKPVDFIYAGIDSDERLEEIRSFLPADMNVQKSSGTFILITNKEVSKLKALKILVENFNINMKETLTFGNHYNDIDMIRASGKGIAVENAIDEVRAAADEITASNDKDGVAHFIENLLLL